MNSPRPDPLIQARSLAHRGSYEQALDLCSQVEVDGRAVTDAVALRALTLALRGDVAAAKEQLVRLPLPSEFGNVDALVDAGSAWLKLETPTPGLPFLGEAIRRAPSNPLANARLGALLSQLSRFRDALPYLEKARDLWPSIGGVRLNLARAYLNLNRADDAWRELEACADKTDMDRLLYNSSRVEVLMAQKRSTEAGAEAKRLAEDDADPRAARVAAKALAGLDCHDEAEGILRKALEQQPDDIGLLEDLAELAQIRGRFGQAAHLIRQVLERQPDNARLWSRLAMMAGRRLDNEMARAAAAKAMELTREAHGQERAIALAAHAHMLADADDAAAESAYRDALRESADCVPAISGLGHLLMQLGRIEEATQLFEHLKRLAPLQAWSQLIHARQLPGDPAILERMEQAARRPSLEGAVQGHLLFVAAAAWERKKEYARAFALAEEANNAARKHLSYSPQAHRARVERIMARFSAAFMASRAGWGLESDLPVFVLGMPRSGTTLVEQIIGSHSRAHGAGELGIVPQQIQKLNAWERKLGSGRDYPDCIADLTAREAKKFAEQLLAELQAFAPEAARVVDKLPHNFENIGLIKMLFPNARIVHCVREPRDIAISNYFTDYDAKFGGMGFAYDQGWIGEQLADHRRLMAHWHAVFPGQILDVPYEALVEDTEGWARRMIDYLSLDWEPGVLEFQNLDRPVKTASVWQVRQTVYKTSREKWRHYESHLGPLESALAQHPADPPPMALPTLPPGLFLEGMEQLGKERPDLAEGCFRQLLLEQPRHAAARQFLGAALASQGKAEEAVREMRLSVRLRPGHISWYQNLANVLDSLGRTEEAAKLHALAASGRSPGTPDEKVGLVADMTEAA